MVCRRRRDVRNLESLSGAQERRRGPARPRRLSPRRKRLFAVSSPAASGLAAQHVPVLLEEVIAALAISEGETHVDGTFGAGGYTRAMLAEGANVIAFDRDPDAVREALQIGRASWRERGCQYV